jgi:hypothetical protein
VPVGGRPGYSLRAHLSTFEDAAQLYLAVRVTFWRIVWQQGKGDTTGEAAIVIQGFQTGNPIVMGDLRLVRIIQDTFRLSGV